MWSSEMVLMLRYMVNDIGTGNPPAYTYDDSRLRQLLIISAQFMTTEVNLANQYTLDIVNVSISPDPTTLSVRDDAFINLTVLKAACTIDNSEARVAAARAVLMRDTGFMVDNRNPAQAKLLIWKQGWCQHYNDAKVQYRLGNGSPGHAVLGPFRATDSYGPGYGPWVGPDGYMPGIPNYGYAWGSDVPNDGRYR